MTDELDRIADAATGENIAQTVARLSAATEPVREIVATIDEVAFVHEQYRAVDLEQYLPTPRRVRAQAKLSTMQGFVDYVVRHALPDQTAIYVDGSAALAVIDDLKPKEEQGSWKDHTATLKLGRTPQWTAWQAASGQIMKQRDFIHFIQDRAAEIAQPALTALVGHLQEVTATSSGRRQDNASHYNASHLTEGRQRTTTTSIINDLPEYLSLYMPILACEPAIKTLIDARLSVKLDDAGVYCSATLVNPDIVLEERIRQLVETMRGLLTVDNGETVAPIFF